MFVPEITENGGFGETLKGARRARRHLAEDGLDAVGRLRPLSSFESLVLVILRSAEGSGRPPVPRRFFGRPQNDPTLTGAAVRGDGFPTGRSRHNRDGPL
jgi:hypothetical protein